MERSRKLLTPCGAFGAWLLLILSSCSSAVDSNQTAPIGVDQSPARVFVCEGDHEVDDSATGTGQHAWYVPSAMNNKLRHFSEFAAYAGIPAVTDCSTGSAFMDKYVAYSEANPGFDSDEPLDETPLPIPPLPPGHRLGGSEATVDKILNGEPDSLGPIVRIVSHTRASCASLPPTDSFPQCTGTFIAKNWMATAAHCMTVATDGTPVHGWRAYSIDYAGLNGMTNASRCFDYVLQYWDPRYVGYKPNKPNLVFDFALLYIIDTYDNQLSPGPQGRALGLGPWMRLSLRGAVTSDATFWGWGEPDNILESGTIDHYLPVKRDPTNKSALVATIPVTDPVAGGDFAGPYVCHGDSGGPVVDHYDVGPSGSSVREPVLVATLSGSTDTDPNHVCITSPGILIEWDRVDTELAFVNKSMKDWNGPKFQCKTDVQTGGTTKDFAQCWGQPCLIDEQCKSTEYCSNPRSSFEGSTCNVCPGDPGNCDCIFGQCLPVE